MWRSEANHSVLERTRNADVGQRRREDHRIGREPAPTVARQYVGPEFKWRFVSGDRPSPARTARGGLPLTPLFHKDARRAGGDQGPDSVIYDSNANPPTTLRTSTYAPGRRLYFSFSRDGMVSRHGERSRHPAACQPSWDYSCTTQIRKYPRSEVCTRSRSARSPWSSCWPCCQVARVRRRPESRHSLTIARKRNAAPEPSRAP